jgi:NADH-ubiquinone oxidoreductase chain 2
MIFISVLTLIVAKALPSLSRNLSSIYFTRISAIIFVYAGVLSFNTFYIQSIGSGIGLYSGLFQITQVSVLIEVFFLIIGFLILIAWPLYKGMEIKNSYILLNKDYSLIVLFSTLGSCLLISSSDLISMYLSIELQSFGLYVLSTLYRDSESSTNAGLKYFLLGGLSSCLILLGCGVIYSLTGLTNFESIYTIISSSSINYIIQGLSLGLLFIIIGFLFKIAAAPLHNWAPDVYDDTPTIVTIWLTIMPKISIIILLLELQEIATIGTIGTIESVNLLNINTNTYNDILNSLITLKPSSTTYNLGSLGLEGNIMNMNLLKNLLLISSLLSLIIGTVVGLAQTRIKRLLAYSTISHIGFILLALAINTEQSVDSLIFYIIQYTITNLNMFLILIALSYIIITNNLNTNNNNNNNNNKELLFNEGNYLGDIKYISSLKGQFFLNPLLTLSLCICLFSMAGIPPLIGFFSKQFVLYSAIESGYYFMTFIAILVSVVSASYYLKIIKVLLYPEINKEEINNYKELEFNSSPTLPNGKAYAPFGREGSPLGLEIKEKGEILLTNFHSFVISTLTLFILFFILKPSLILNITQLISLSLFNF